MGLLDFFKKIEPDKQKSGFLHTLYDGFFTFMFVPNSRPKNAVHVHDHTDLKRTMIFVVYALIPLYIFGMYNVGHQHYLAAGEMTGLTEGLGAKFLYGAMKVLPIYVISMVVGLGIEFYFAYKKGHGIEEGYLVTGALIPLIMPASIPYWILILAVVFAVVLGKEAFGGTGMNVVNIALLARVFVFFAYPGSISGDTVWVDGVDGYAGATPLGLAPDGWQAVLQHYTPEQMWWGTIPGSIGETSKPLIILGALFLLLSRIASWRIMLGGVIGMVLMGLIFNAWGATPYMNIPWYYHFYMGSFLFAIAFMATDPVTAASTNKGKWIYGLLIGAFGLIIRVFNPAYPEGWMLAILLINVFAPLMDYFVLQSNMKKRLKSA